MSNDLVILVGRAINAQKDLIQKLAEELAEHNIPVTPELREQVINTTMIMHKLAAELEKERATIQ